MRTAGEVTFADAHKQHANEGDFSVVCFQSREDLERALDKLQGKEVNGRKLKLIDDSEKRDSRSRSRSRSRRRSRSRSSRQSSRSRSTRSRSKSASGSPKKDEGSKSRSRSRSGSARSRSASNERSPNGGTQPAENGARDEGVKEDASRSPTPD
uniref:Serine/arginine-rich splicing factor 6 n=1 Tax=Ascaris suum TaxID=6253 RepID=F1L379_ASCSU